MASGYISPWTGRFYSLLDPTYAKDHIPIIASVSEHQPTAWSSFMFDFHILLILFPAGLYFCFKRLSDATIFIVMYGLTSMYFASVMVRLILVAAPAVCLISAIAISATIKNLTTLIRKKSKAALAVTTKATSNLKASAKVAMYKLSYYRFGEVTTEYGKPTGYDRARGVEIGNKDIKLEYLEEAFTTSNWIIRIYKVKPPKNRW
ncbi:hypothetical protein BHM03_00030649 [Ensete ventricosum]|nr:hypothetical protein BHM03_00030649 [Ensete ventricosum]